MGRGNVAVRQWIRDKKRFADLFNGIVFQGRKVIAPEELEVVDSESDIFLTDQRGKNKGIERYRDVVMKWKYDMRLAVLACENQDQVHYAMAVRNMVYDSLNYAEQVKQIGKFHKEKGDKLARAEFLSGFRKDDKIFPVITLVFYYDIKEWDGSRDLHGMFHLEEWGNERKFLETYVPNYRINLVDAGRIEDIERFRTDLQEMFGMMKCRGSRKELQRYLQEHEAYFQNMDLETYQAAKVFLRSGSLLEKSMKEQDGLEENNMCKALEELYNDGVKEGRMDGIAALIEILQEFNQSKEEVREKLQEKMSISFPEAQIYIEKYWKQSA